MAEACSAQSPGAGKGATFTVELPVQRTTRRDARSEPRLAANAVSEDLVERLEGARVIVVDDDADSREVVTAILMHAGATVTGVASVADALAAIRRTRPDIVV
jgi:PleD family two-component response regulator